MAYTESDLGILPTVCGGDSLNHNMEAIRRFAKKAVPAINFLEFWNNYDPALQGAFMLRGDLLAILTEGGSADISEVHTGIHVTVYDDLLATGQTIASGIRVHAYFDVQDGLYYVGSAMCP